MAQVENWHLECIGYLQEMAMRIFQRVRVNKSVCFCVFMC